MAGSKDWMETWRPTQAELDQKAQENLDKLNEDLEQRREIEAQYDAEREQDR